MNDCNRMTIKITRLTALLMICLSIAACGGKKQAAPAEEQPVADITRPPQMVKEEPREVVEEGDPDETVSYEEWQRRRQAELNEENP